MELTARERQALEKADGLNAILSQSSIKEGAEAADLRARRQAAQQLAAQNRAQDQSDLEATMQYRMSEGDLDRAQRMKIAKMNARAYGRGDPMDDLTAPEQRKAREQEMTYSGAENAIGQLDALPEGQTSSGVTGYFYNVLKDNSFTNLAKLLGAAVYSGDEKQARASVDASVESFKRALAGANLTANEVGLSSNWDPSQALTDEDKVMRLQEMSPVMCSSSK